MSEIEHITAAVVNFRDERDWAQFHDSKNLAAAISIEAAELNELFLWKSTVQSETVSGDLIKEELADVLLYSFLLAHRHGFNIGEIMMQKMKKNAEKYPIDKSKGNSKKYDEL
jgi:NTP pyrophosphatase (non-canonical NTP hydrolase)